VRAARPSRRQVWPGKNSTRKGHCLVRFLTVGGATRAGAEHSRAHGRSDNAPVRPIPPSSTPEEFADPSDSEDRCDTRPRSGRGIARSVPPCPQPFAGRFKARVSNSYAEEFGGSARREGRGFSLAPSPPRKRKWVSLGIRSPDVHRGSPRRTCSRTVRVRAAAGYHTPGCRLGNHSSNSGRTCPSRSIRSTSSREATAAGAISQCGTSRWAASGTKSGSPNFPSPNRPTHACTFGSTRNRTNRSASERWTVGCFPGFTTYAW
jgi:hypothetical protein